ncbi:DUF1800 family protein [Granulosicoccus antarcticus]|uniref:DUF1800 family protein n=1 Tax=Granulosicoccus antarcticus TaxID=437505 RepID=UPI00146FBD9D|nr:DUF1800 family protein [Granulosicoccus antarcticus]
MSCFTVPAFATVYSDAENGVADWQVYDALPAGAEVVSDFDDVLDSQVIRTRGDQRNNGYLLGGTSAAAGWNNTTEFHINWRMQVAESYAIYVRVDTTDGWRYLAYTNSNSDSLANPSGEYISHGLGSSTTDGRWRVFSRDLAQDLADAQPDNALIAVNGFLVRGSVLLDDITLADAAVRQTVLPVVSSVVDANAEDGSTSGWQIFDDLPAGASIAVVADEASGSQVFELTGAGRSNGYQLGGLDSVDGWNNTTQFNIAWDMLSSESYQVYVRVDTANGWRYVVYSNSNSDSLLSSNGRDIGFGLGSASVDGQWHSIVRDLAADVATGDPGNTLLAVHGFLVRGSLRLDNIRLFDSPEVQAIPPVALISGGDRSVTLGETVVLDGSASTDDIGIAAYQWNDADGAPLGNEAQLIVTTSEAGTFSYQLTVTDESGLTATALTQISVQDGTAPTIYEDAEDSAISRWLISDTTPAGASIENIQDAARNSRVLQLTGDGQQNAFLIGNYDSRAPGWNNQLQTHLRWSMKTDAGFAIYVRLETADGFRYLIYDQYGSDRGSSSASSLRFGLGSGAHDGSWQTFTRNVRDDLGKFQPGNSLIAVHGMQFRGSFLVDDLQMLNLVDDTPGEPVFEDAEDSSISRWRITDNTPGGAAITNVRDDDRDSRVIELKGNGQANAYLLGGYDSRSPGWNNTEQTHLRWSMKTNEGFSVYVSLETADGFRYLIYDQYTSARGDEASSNLRFGLGRDAYDGSWQTFTRNIHADLASLQPGNSVIAVHGVQFRGDFLVDDIGMLTIVDASPTAVLSVTQSEGAAPLLTVFDASASSDDYGLVSYAFDFGDGSEPLSGGESVVTHSYAEAGDFTAVVTVTDSAGQSATAEIGISVLSDSEAPVASLTAAPVEGFIPLTTVLDATASTDNVGIVSYVWNFGDGTAEEGPELASVSHDYTVAGEYTATVTVSDAAGLQSSATLTITASPEAVEDNPPVAAFSIDSPQTGSTVNFLNESTDDNEVTRVLWNFGDATESGQSNELSPLYSYSSIGDYTVTLTVLDGAGQMDTATQIISITELDEESEELSIQVSSEALTGETPFTARFDASATTGGEGDLTFLWLTEMLDESGVATGEQGPSSEGALAELLLSTAGSYRVTLTVLDELENSAQTTLLVTVTEGQSSGVTPSEAARFLAQASFGATTESIAKVQSMGLEAWIDDQFTLQGAPHLDFVQTHSNGSGQEPRHEVWWRDVVDGEDQLRQRVAFALSQIFVVSDQGYTLGNAQYGVTRYYDQLREQAFGNYRELLETVTLSPVMGVYLSMLQNARGEISSNTRADENFAREVLQLFSIGLYELNIDGTKKLSGGQPIHSFTQNQIENYSRIYTGWNFGGATDWTITSINGNANKLVPMQAWPQYHDDDPKWLLGGVVAPASNGAEADLQMALDSIANHANVGPFISRQLIQRLVTSNPTPGYIARVSGVFNNNGAGVRGDLKAVVKAILLDDEARHGHENVADFGKLREPVLRLSHLWRAFNITRGSGSQNGVYNTPSPHVKDLDSVGGQAVLKSPSVFNFYHPDYAPLGAIYAQGKAAPEAEIYTDDTILSMTNRIDKQIQYGHDASDSNAKRTSYLNLSAERALAALGTTELLDHLDVLLLSGSMSDGLRSVLANHIDSLPAANTAADQSQRVRDALSLIMASPDYLVQM